MTAEHPPYLLEFLERFRTIWASPRDHVDTFLDNLSPDIRLTAPIVGSSRGREAGYRAFRQAFGALPDLHGEVGAWAFDGRALFIEMEFRATVGGKPMRWANIDRFVFEEGVAVERRAFFDPLPLLAAFLRRPSGWVQLWKLRPRR